MSACDTSTFGGGFQSKENKQSTKIEVGFNGGVLSYNVKDADGNIATSRDFKVGDYARIVEVPAGEEIDEDAIEDLDELPCGEIQGFWTCLDGSSGMTNGAELKRKFGLRRLPLRVLLPMDNPQKKPVKDPEEL